MLDSPNSACCRSVMNSSLVVTIRRYPTLPGCSGRGGVQIGGGIGNWLPETSAVAGSSSMPARGSLLTGPCPPRVRWHSAAPWCRVAALPTGSLVPTSPGCGSTWCTASQWWLWALLPDLLSPDFTRKTGNKTSPGNTRQFWIVETGLTMWSLVQRLIAHLLLLAYHMYYGPHDIHSVPLFIDQLTTHIN